MERQIVSEIELNSRKITLETGFIARQAGGSVLVKSGETVILVAATANSEIPEEAGFFPLSVEYRERFYAAGKIPGGFIKREGRPTENEILISRLIDRPIRPLFKKDFRNEVQIIATVLSADGENNPDVLGIIGASVAIKLAGLPILKLVGAIRVGRVNGEFIVNPTTTELKNSDLEIVVAGTEDNIVMLEGEGNEISESDFLELLYFAHNEIKKIVEFENEFIKQVEIKEFNYTPYVIDENLKNIVREKSYETIIKANHIPDKKARQNILDEMKRTIIEELKEQFPETINQVNEIVEEFEAEHMRKMILEENRRIDGRKENEIREIVEKIRVLPRPHGSALFTRGQTQALVVTTLGSKTDQQLIDGLEEEFAKSYMLHYNFPPFSVGEVRPIRGLSRREIGHGMLAERSLAFVIPSENHFPYTIRVVSDILESNGSSSMATVCGGSLSLMDAGVPIKTHVAGVAMGLITNEDKYIILTDITGAEDHYGDMDFKIAGTRKGITGCQLDVKILGLKMEILNEVLTRARVALNSILDIMFATIEKPKPELSPYAPRIKIIKISPDKIGIVIGQGGRNIKYIQEKTNTTISIDPDGTVYISGHNEQSNSDAEKLIMEIAEEVEIGKIYNGKVIKLASYGAFVEIFPSQVGLVHISEIADGYVKDISNFVKEGDNIKVKVIGIDESDRIKLSMKQVENKKSK